MIISISISVIGFLNVYRLLRLVFRDFYFPRKIQIFWSFILTFIILFLFYLFLKRPLLLWSGLFLISIFLIILPNFIRYTLEKKLKSLMIPFLDEIILSIQQGKSLRNSIEQSMQRQQGFFKAQIHELYNSLIFPGSKVKFRSPFFKRMCHEFTEIDKSQSRCLDQIRILRRQLKIQENFRRKSGQASQQAHTQAAILSFFQLILTVFVILNFGWRDNVYLITSSTFLFFLGLVLIFWIGRLSKWKI